MKPLTLLSLAVITFTACGQGRVDRADPVDDTTNGLADQSTCAAAGGTCVALTPTSCASGDWGDPATCGGSVGVGCCLPSEPTECTPITLAPGNPAAMYCAGLGYQLDGSACAFPDGTNCDQWAFFRGDCGQARSFCNLHGGTVTSETRDFGEWTAVLAVCTLPTGKKCDEALYAGSCVCE